MNKVIHAHELMDFIDENPGIQTYDELKTQFVNLIGNVQFTNCTKNVYSFEEIVKFLSERNKITYTEKGIEVIKEHKCDHD